ncbi:MAG: single-stranded DNA-binding protein [Bacteroidia bacterium]
MIIHLHAYLGQNIENLKTDRGQTYYKMSVAERVGKEEEPQWFTVFCHQLPAKLVPFLKKGSLVFISGKLSISTYKEKLNLIINAFEVQLLFSKQEEKEEK